ncbi:unnamed protein product [Absidia cylindrospora]
MLSQSLVRKSYSDKKSMIADVEKFALKNGFGISQNPANRGRAMKMHCNQRQRGDDKPSKSSKKTTTFQTAPVSCNWKAYGKLSEDGSHWQIIHVVIHDNSMMTDSDQSLINVESVVEHSHELISNPAITSYIYPSARKMGDQVKQTVVNMCKKQCRTGKNQSNTQQQRHPRQIA